MKYLILIAVFIFSACTTTPQQVIATACTRDQNYLVERCAKSVADVYAVYQQRGLELALNLSTPTEVRDGIKRVSAVSSPIMLDLLRVTQLYIEAKITAVNDPLAKQRLELEAQRLEEKISSAQTRVDAMKKLTGG